MSQSPEADRLAVIGVALLLAICHHFPLSVTLSKKSIVFDKPLGPGSTN